MDFKKISFLSVLVFAVFISSCRKDDDNVPSELDEQLEDALEKASNGVGKSFYVMPSSSDLAAIPQDPKNPLTTQKVELGKFLYHETGLAVSPMMDDSKGQFSCASCHFASAGFQANRFQGLSEGGQGFGINGEGREKKPSYDGSMAGLNNMEFHAIGLQDLHDCPEEVLNTMEDDPAHLGRGSFTGLSEDMYKFKVPQLYNIMDSPFLGHGSSIRSTRAMVEYKNRAIQQNPDVPASQLADEFIPLNLSEEEIVDIVAFINQALYDPNLKRYEPESLPSGNCFPFSDPMARVDLGCD